MNEIDHHFISLKFLTAIILALVFAFLLIYVFSPVERTDYPVYSFEKKESNIFNSENSPLLSQKAETAVDIAKRDEFKQKLKNRSFALMDRSKEATAAVITGNHLGAVNSLKEEENILLNDFKLELKEKEEELLAQKRSELETELSNQLQKLRQKVRDRYADYSQQQIKENYLKMINLRIAFEVLAQNESEKEKYQKELDKIIAAQEKILAEKNNVLNEEISNETRSLIMDFNREYAAYREKVQKENEKLLQERKAKLESELDQKRETIKSELAKKLTEKNSIMENLIQRAKRHY